MIEEISELSVAGQNNQDYFRTFRSADLLQLIKHDDIPTQAVQFK